MNRMGRLILAAMALLAPFAVHAAPDANGFPALTGDVIDDAHVLSPGARQTLTDELTRLHRTSGHSLVVLTVDSLHFNSSATDSTLKSSQ